MTKQKRDDDARSNPSNEAKPKSHYGSTGVRKHCMSKKAVHLDFFQNLSRVYWEKDPQGELCNGDE